MGKKKFIDKKKSATFVLRFKETADTEDDSAARVFQRVDGGESHIPGFSEEDPQPNYGSNDDGGEEEDEAPLDESSMFADADEDGGGDDLRSQQLQRRVARPGQKGPLPDHIRVELVELGFPDDGYDYLQHMRKIGTAGVGGAFVPTNRLQLDRLRTDVKVYDSSKVTVQAAAEADEKDIIVAVGSSTRPLRRPAYVEDGLDPEVAAALADSDGSQFDSADELEDDFVVFANDTPEGSTSQEVLAPSAATVKTANAGLGRNLVEEEDDEDDEEFSDEEDTHSMATTENIRQRPSRLLDEQFEMLALREYDDDEFGELEEEDFEARGHADISQFDDVLSEFLTGGDKYMTPAEINAKKAASASSVLKTSEACRDSTTLNMPKESNVRDGPCARTQESKAEDRAGDESLKVGRVEVDPSSDDSEDDLVVVEIESEDERSNWDCESVVSTLSNLDNHPGKIVAPSKPRHKPPTLEKVLEDKEAKGGIIRLRGKQHLPTDFLPAKPGLEKSTRKTKSSVKTGDTELGQKAGSRAGETPEERKARKAAVKEERRDARVAKKALKIRYKDEIQRAQHGAAHTGPSGIHLP